MKSLIERIEDHLRTWTPYEIEARIGSGLLVEALEELKRYDRRSLVELDKELDKEKT